MATPDAAAIPDGDGGSVRGVVVAVPVGGNPRWADGGVQL
jgi:hypothetical protein